MLCQLSEMSDISPSKVMDIVPEASAAQIADFLRLAETTASEVAKKRRREPRKEHSRSKTPGLLDSISLSGQSPEPAEVKGPNSPAEVDSTIMKELGKLVPPKDGGTIPTVEFTKNFQNKILNLLEASNTPTRFNAEHFEKVYQKLEKDPLARARLENLFAARAHKYGYSHFGQKHLFRETPYVARKLKSQAERRKFRAGLKGLVDFLNQLHVMDLEKLLQKGNAEGFKALRLPNSIPPETMCKYLKDTPF